MATPLSRLMNKTDILASMFVFLGIAVLLLYPNRIGISKYLESRLMTVQEETVSGVYAPGAVFSDELPDGGWGPLLIAVPPGRFTVPGDAQVEPRDVEISRSFAAGVYEVTVEEFAQFVAAAAYQIEAGCYFHTQAQEWVLMGSADWRSPNYQQADEHPVTCINWSDAQAYVGWLSKVTGQRYRLPTEAEFQYLRRGGGEYPWGHSIDDSSDLCRYGNGADITTGLDYATECVDGYAYAAPVGSFPANGFGLHDLMGNLWEFTEDCWNSELRAGWRNLFIGPPNDGTAWYFGNCTYHVLQGGSFLSSARNLQVTTREQGGGNLRLVRNGLRVVRDL